MIEAIEVQVISKLLTCDDDYVIDTLLSYDHTYFNGYLREFEYISTHKQKYGSVPGTFDFLAQFPDFSIVDVPEPLEYLQDRLREYKRYLLLLETFNKIKDLGEGDVVDAWKYLELQCDKAEGLGNIAPMNIVRDAEKRANQVQEYSKQQRIPTGFAEIDKVMYGGLSTIEELLVIVARTNSGKAQPLWAPVLTPQGWTTMGQLQVGDTVVGANNDNGKVVQLFPQGKKEYYRVTFDDNTSVECCDDHLWVVLDDVRRHRENAHYGEPLVLPLKEIRQNLTKVRYSVDLTSPIEFESNFNESAELDGYLLGLLLGDGSLRDGRAMLTNESDEIWATVEKIVSKYNCKRSEKSKYSIVSTDPKCPNFVRNKLIEYGLMNKKSIDKFIPEKYFTAPVHVRKALLAGLVDTDGYAPKDAAMLWEFDTASEQLAQDFARLARSLGVWVKVSDRKPTYYKTADGVRHAGNGVRHMSCRSPFNPFIFSEKANRYNNDWSARGGTAPKRMCKMINSIELIGETECQCILLDNNSHTYITSEYTVTHNTWVCTRMMEAAQRAGFPVAYYSPEMQAAFLGTRFDTWRNHFENSQLFKGNYSEAYHKYLQELSNEQAGAFVIEDKDAEDGVSVRYLSAVVKKYGIKLLIVDGISYMHDVEKSFTTQDKYKNIAQGLFQLSKQYGCAVVLVMQANREVKNKDDKGESIPDMYNAEGSDHPCRIATQAFGIRQIFDKHVLDIKMLKSRNAMNVNPVFSYAWDINTGNMSYIPGDGTESGTTVAPVTLPALSAPILQSTHQPDANDISLIADDSDDIEF